VQPRTTPADEHDGYSASKYYSTFQEPGKKEHATHGSAGDLAALDQVEDPERAVRQFVTQHNAYLSLQHVVTSCATLLGQYAEQTAEQACNDILKARQK
jgi:hypothetical protein